MIRVAVVEDERGCQEQICGYLKRYGEENELEFQTTVFSDGLDIVENYNPVWDIIFMDIRMKHMDGMTAAAKIRTYDPGALLIFITTMGQYAIRGYEVDAMDFVLKPVAYPQFAMKLTKAVCALKKKKERYLLLPVEERRDRVSVSEVFFIEVKGHNLHVVTERQTYVLRGSMQEMEKELAGCYFARCNNPYLVNLRNVTGVTKEHVLVGGYRLPISRTKKKQFLGELSEYLSAGYR